MKKHFSRVLITGTTSGLGRAFKNHYESVGSEVLTINRRDTAETISPLNTVTDICDPNQVASYLRALKDRHCLPDLFLLNAGINRADNLDRLDLEEFQEVWKVNVMGVLSFISALQQLRISGRTIAVLSSTSNIVPNPAHLGYFASKLVLHELIQLLAKKDTQNQYKSIILSPVRTNIMAGYPAPTGLQGKIFNLLATQPTEAVADLAHFMGSEKTVLYYTRSACLFYFLVRQVLRVWPRLYGGTKPKAQLELVTSHRI